MKSSVKKICLIAMFTALMCVLSPLSIPIGPVPISLSTFMVYLIGALFDWKIAPLIVGLYIVLGVIGVPVFSSFKAGPAVIAGPTGGFIIGYLFGVLVESLLLTYFKSKKWMYPASMVLATFFIYGFGLIWFMIFMGDKYTFEKALMVCVVPFLGGDTIKIVVSTMIAIPLRKLFDAQNAVKQR